MDKTNKNFGTQTSQQGAKTTPGSSDINMNRQASGNVDQDVGVGNVQQGAQKDLNSDIDLNDDEDEDKF